MKILVAPVFLGVTFSVVNLFVDFKSWILLFVGIAVYTILFALITWFFAMNNYEKDIFKGPVKVVFNKLKFVNNRR